MDKNTWKRIERVFYEAIERDVSEWPAFLDEACGGDPELRREVEALLAHDTRTGRFFDFEDTRRALAEEFLVRSAIPVTGRSVGPYRLEREIGSGGMGRVFLAEREDLPKRVALKLVREPLASPDRGHRFRLEQRVLAGLEHPHIAQLLDAGITDDGSPWFALEYVDGESISTFCDSTRKTVEQRLRLFLDVCSAVRYAHANLVVHRDIKPSNVMVTRDGRPKLLDFGVAKLLDSTATNELTRTGLRIFTPAYAAPEQLTGGRISTATDVYQLGGLLYELLAGRPPLDLAGKSAGEVEWIVREQEPASPSSAVTQETTHTRPDGSVEQLSPADISGMRSTTPERLRRRLGGDLENVVLKALEKEPERRYISVDAFAGDIERFLEGRPVLAQPVTAGYRAKKFLLRHKAAAGIALLVVGYAVTATLSAVGIARERDRASASAATAQREAAKSERVTGYLVDLFEGADPGVAQGDTITARELLARGVERADALDDQPEVQAVLLDVTGTIYFNLGNPQQAEALHRRSFDVWEAMEAHPARADGRMRAMLGLARALVPQHRYAEAEPLLRTVVARGSSGEVEDDIYRRALFDLYVTLHAMGRRASADSAFVAWDATFAQSVAPSDPVTAARMVELGQTLGYGGQISGDLEALQRGRALIDGALATLRAKRGRRHPSVGNALNEKASLLIAEMLLRPASEPVDAGVLAAADSVTSEAVILNRAIYPEPSNQLWGSLQNRATVLLQLKEFDEAEKTARDALVTAEAVENDNIRVSSIRLLGQIALTKGAYEDALDRFREKRDWLARLHGDGYLNTLIADLEIAEALTGAERFEEAEMKLTAAHAKLEQGRGRADRYTQAALSHLVVLYERWNRPEQAARFRALLHTARDEG